MTHEPQQTLPIDLPAVANHAPPPAAATPTPSGDWGNLFSALRRSWYVLPVLLAVAIAGAIQRGAADDDVYRSEAVVLMSPSTSFKEPYQVVDALSTLKDRFALGTFADMVESPSTLESAAVDAGINRSQLRTVQVQADLSQESYIIRIAVDAPTASSATMLNAALLQTSVERFVSTYPAFALTPLESPTSPDQPLPGHQTADLALACAAAIVLWAALSLLLAKLRS